MSATPIPRRGLALATRSGRAPFRTADAVKVPLPVELFHRVGSGSIPRGRVVDDRGGRARGSAA